ncbi:V-type proton ATPase subunit E-like [Lycorma delicatula]|uniref:V-type proton ATPase subunit E-like n=1 Tax=Lycorma delicatula TaxID=130591 RepID=UPI003F516BFB
MAYRSHNLRKSTNIDNEIKRMVEYIEQDSLEKVEEIDIRTEEEFIIEKNKCRDKEIVKIAAYYDNLETRLAREYDAEICRLLHSFHMNYLKAEDAVIEDVRKKARYRLKNIDCEGNVDAYRKILSALLLQGFLKLLDDEIRIMVREKDKTIIDDCIKTAEDAYKEVTKKKVKSTVESTYLPPDCFGGVVLSSRKGTVSVDNTLEYRLQIIADSPHSPLLPVYRLMLFGINPSRKHFD